MLPQATSSCPSRHIKHCCCAQSTVTLLLYIQHSDAVAVQVDQTRKALDSVTLLAHSVCQLSGGKLPASSPVVSLLALLHSSGHEYAGSIGLARGRCSSMLTLLPVHLWFSLLTKCKPRKLACTDKPTMALLRCGHLCFLLCIDPALRVLVQMAEDTAGGQSALEAAQRASGLLGSRNTTSDAAHELSLCAEDMTSLTGYHQHTAAEQLAAVPQTQPAVSAAQSGSTASSQQLTVSGLREEQLDSQPASPTTNDQTHALTLQLEQAQQEREEMAQKVMLLIDL